MANPFMFGSVAGGDYFTNRVEELKEVRAVLDSSNHLVLISPRRFGKTSLIEKAISNLDRPIVYLDLQMITSVADLASQLLRHFLKTNKLERIKHFLLNFRIIPAIEFNPLTNETSVSFSPKVMDDFTPLEDVLDLIDKSSEHGKRTIVVLDEFQEIISISKSLPKQLRSVIQHHSNVNYVFLGSVESMMREIFETKKSPFYHFGALVTLKRIPYSDFCKYLQKRFAKVTLESEAVSTEVLSVTNCHPYYTQQLAFYCYENLATEPYSRDLITRAIGRIVALHSNDFERLWNKLNKTEKSVLIALATEKGIKSTGLATSTAYSALKSLATNGLLIKEETYTFDDPFFAAWIKIGRQ